MDCSCYSEGLVGRFQVANITAEVDLPQAGGYNICLTALIQIRFGQRECVLDQFKARFRVGSDNHFYDIESEKNIGIIEHSQPCKRTARNSLPFFAIHRFHRPAEMFVRARFHFHKDQRVIVTTDNINFAAAAAAEIAQQDFVTVTLQIAAR
jgi:hypothetical protein